MHWLLKLTIERPPLRVNASSSRTISSGPGSQ
jgi:hypothetical protein